MKLNKIIVIETIIFNADRQTDATQEFSEMKFGKKGFVSNIDANDGNGTEVIFRYFLNERNKKGDLVLQPE